MLGQLWRKRLRSFWKVLRGQTARTGRSRRADNRLRSYRPHLEPLEARWLLSTFTVLNNLDSGAGSLRDAVSQANMAAGADTIQFAPGLRGQTITLTGGELDVTDSVTIDGSGVTVSGNNASGVFVITA